MLLFPFRLALKIVELLVLGIIAYLVTSAVQVILASGITSATIATTPANAIIVLGAPTNGTAPGTDLADQLNDALALYRGHLAPTIVVTGSGTGSDAVPAVGWQWLVHEGVPSSAITEIPANDAVAGLADAHAELAGRADVIIVTDAIDTFWTAKVAALDGFAAQISPASGSKKFVASEIGPLWKQTTAIAAGRIIGFSRTSWAAS